MIYKLIEQINFIIVFKSLNQQMLPDQFGMRHDQNEAIVEGKALLAAELYINLLQLLQDEFCRYLSFVLHFKYFSIDDVIFHAYHR